MKRNQVSFITLFVVVVLVTAGCSGSASNESEGGTSEGTITLRVATYFASTSPMAYGIIEPWMERVTEITDGKVEFEYYPSEQLGAADDLLDLTDNGVADISTVVSDYNSDKMKYTTFLANYPGLSDSVNQGTLALNKLLQENETVLENDFLNNGVRPMIGIYPPGDDIWSIGKEIRTPEDLKGLNIRTKGGMINELYEQLGTNPVSLPFPEMYEALERGVVDATATYNMGIKNAGLGELVNYSTPLQIGAAIHTLAINEDRWQELPEDIQDAMNLASEEIVEDIGSIYDEEVEAFMNEYRENGGVVVKLTEEEREQWTDEFNKWAEKWLEENDTGDQYRDVLKAFQELLEEYK